MNEHPASRTSGQRTLRIFPALLLLAAVLGMASAAQAACALSGPAPIDLVPTGYVPGANALQTIPAAASVDGGSAACTWAIGAEDNGAASRVLNGPGGAIPFDLYPGTVAGARWRDLPLAGRSELLTGTTGAGQRGNAPFTISIPGQVVLAPGTYTAALRLHLYEADASAPSGYREREVRELRLSLTLLPFVNGRVEFDGSASAFGARRVLDFGELAADAHRTLRLILDTNIAVGVSVLAEEVGRLVSRHAYGQASVPFQVNPTRFDKVASGYEVEFEVRIGPLGVATPGDYLSGVTFTVTAR